MPLTGNAAFQAAGGAALVAAHGGAVVPSSRPPPENSRPQPRRKMVYCAQSRKVPLNNKPVAMAEPEAQNRIVVYQPNETVRPWPF